MFTPAQARAYDAWRTAGPPEDVNEEGYELQSEMTLAELAEELENLMFEGDELPSRQAAAIDALRRNAFDLLRTELTKLEDSPELWDEDGEMVNENDPIHALIAHADSLIGKAVSYHHYR